MCKTMTLLICALLLSGCTTEWRKTRTDARDLSVVRHECREKAEDKYPIKNMIAHKTVYDTSNDHCSKKKNCKDIKTNAPALQSYVIDVNEDTRDDWFDNCMRQNGWDSDIKFRL